LTIRGNTSILSDCMDAPKSGCGADSGIQSFGSSEGEYGYRVAGQTSFE
jgi:hypothetical protein